MNALNKGLGQGLVMRTATSHEDVERVAAFNGLIHGPELAVTLRRLLLNYAGLDGRDIIFIEDAATGEIASSLLLLPWTLRYGGIPVRDPVPASGVVHLHELLILHVRRRVIVCQVVCLAAKQLTS